MEVCREIRSRHPEIACVMLTSYSDDDALFARDHGRRVGYLLKQIRGTDIVDAVRRAGAGESLLDPAVTRRLLDQFRAPPADDERLARLTGRSGASSTLIAEGLTNRQIAAEVHLAEKTVKNYVSNVLSKLGMERRTQAAVFAARLAD